MRIGPSDMHATWTDAVIKWADGNAWVKLIPTASPVYSCYRPPAAEQGTSEEAAVATEAGQSAAVAPAAPDSETAPAAGLDDEAMPMAEPDDDLMLAMPFGAAEIQEPPPSR